MKNKLEQIKQKVNTLQYKLILFFVFFLMLSVFLNFLVINLHLQNYGNRPIRVENIDISGLGANRPIRNQIEQRIKQERAEIEESIRAIMIFSFIVQLLIAVVGSTLIVKTSLHPLKKLKNTMAKIDTLDLKASTLEIESNDEVGELVANFNKMITTIQKLVEKEKEFIQNISHELKTPLATMRVNLESILLLQEHKEDSEQIQSTISSIDSMARLIDDLILISNIEQNLKIDSTCDVIKTTKSVISTNTYQNIDIEFTSSSNSCNIQGSDVLFARVVENLIGNSIKYSEQKVKIKVDIRVENKFIVLTFADNGIGIPKQKLGKIFDRFYRVDSSRSRQTGGAGLGLSIVKDIVLLHGGTIEVESEESVGTIFTIRLPIPVQR